MLLSRRLAGVLSGFVERVGQLAAWSFLLLVGVVIFDVVTRRFLVLGSTKLQELEWHIHTFLFCFTLGAGYVRNVHVRVDLVRERLGPRSQALIEILGILFLLLPFLALMIHYGYAFALKAYVEGEVSSAGTGLGHRWVVKAFVPAGLCLLLLAAIARLLLAVDELLPATRRHTEAPPPVSSRFMCEGNDP